MKKSVYAYKPLGDKIYMAKGIPNGFSYHIDNWLIGRGQNTIDAKRLLPVMWMYLKSSAACAFVYIFYVIEDYTYYLFSKKSSIETRWDFIINQLEYFFVQGYYAKLLFGLLVATLFLLIALSIILARYPTPLRFNQSNGLVYYKLKGKIWVTPWQQAQIKLWRFANTYSARMVVERAIAVRLFSLNRKGELIERWEPIAGIDNLDLDEQALGGDPSLLFWNWLNGYMQKRAVPEPKIGKISLFEKLHFRAYKHPKNLESKAEALHQRLLDEKLYPSKQSDLSQCSPVPNDPHFTFLEDFPHMQKPQYQIETAARFAAQQHR
ncbi:MAG: hypothetical protein OFPII_19860 [Osedax symbiont Rs1]|nr:MAG: hypothetical protein OFPII_19860 [Osedax symbiont Rs1]